MIHKPDPVADDAFRGIVPGIIDAPCNEMLGKDRWFLAPLARKLKAVAEFVENRALARLEIVIRERRISVALATGITRHLALVFLQQGNGVVLRLGNIELQTDKKFLSGIASDALFHRQYTC